MPQGRFELRRRPHLPRAPLRAWDAADAYLLRHLAELAPPQPATLILNDSFGALAVALSHWRPESCSDSFLSHAATRENLGRAGRAADAVRLGDPLDLSGGPLDLLVLRVPKSLALLEHELCEVRPRLHPDTLVLGAAMVRHLPRTALRLLERLVGPTTTSRAHQKARLLFTAVRPSTAGNPNPYPSRYALEGTPHTLLNHANVFSRARLDGGARLLLRHLPRLDGPAEVLDLGCGNGVLGVMAAHRCPAARLHFRDASYMAVASARANFAAAHGARRAATFTVEDGLDGLPPASMDLILLNPPFHQQQVVGDFIARRLLSGARRALRPGGALWVVGNRHLGYHRRLRRLFGACRLVASDPRFVVLRAQRAAP